MNQTALATRSLLAAALLAAAATTATTAPAAASPDASPRAYNCPIGSFCIYSGWDGGGTRCQWPDRERTNTNDDCSFIRAGHNVLSVWNNTNHRVQYFTGTNYQDRVGSTNSLEGGNLKGNYKIMSFKPQ